MDKYLELLKKLESGEELSEQELGSLAELRQDIESGTVELPEDSPFTSVEEFSANYNEVMSQILSSPEYKAKMEKLAKDKKANNISTKAAQGLDLLMTVGDIKTSRDQINQSDKGLEGLKKPSIPTAPRRNPLLSQQLRQAQLNINDQSGSLAPVQLQIADQFQQDLNTAKTASTGQAGTFGALAQVAANRRNRANLNLAPIAQQGTNQARARFDNLLGMRQEEIQNEFRNEAYSSRLGLDQYNTEAAALGNLGAAGRQNLRNSFGKLAGSIAPLVGQIGAGMGSRSQAQESGFGPDIDAYANDIDGSLFGRFQSPYMNNNFRDV